jgi:hypothetical protein
MWRGCWVDRDRTGWIRRPCEDDRVPAPRFTADDRPADILNGIGRWLAAELGWQWVKSRRTAEARNGPLVLRLILQSSTWSRAGVATWVSARVSVLDDDLRAWRLARPDETVFPASRVLPFACNTMLLSVEPELQTLECSGLPQPLSAPRAMTTSEFAARFREQVLPVLGLFGSSRLLAAEMPDSWLVTVDSGTIEQALARHDRESAAALLGRYMERPLRGHQTWPDRIGGFRHGWDSTPGDDRPPQHGTGALGWLARLHKLPGPASFREPRPESTPLAPP